MNNKEIKDRIIGLSKQKYDIGTHLRGIKDRCKEQKQILSKANQKISALEHDIWCCESRLCNIQGEHDALRKVLGEEEHRKILPNLLKYQL